MKLISVVLMCCIGCCEHKPIKEWRPLVQVWNSNGESCGGKDNGGSQVSSRELNSAFCRSGRGIIIGIGTKL